MLALLWWGRHSALGDWMPLRWSDLQPQASAELRAWQYVVIHHSAGEVGNAESIDRDHLSRGWDGIGYHFVINNGAPLPPGRVEWTFRWNLQRHGAHVAAGEMNRQGIGICLVGHLDRHPPHPRQYERAVELTALLLKHIPSLAIERVVGHGEVPGASTNCPGAHMDMHEFRLAVSRKLADLRQP